MLGRRFQDAAAEDVGEQLVACLLEGGGGRNSSRFRTLFRHARSAPLFRSGGRVRTAPQCNSGPCAMQRPRPWLASRGGGAASSFRGVTAGRRRGVPDGEGTSEGGSMSDEKDQVYGPERAERLVALLRALAERIQELDRAGRLLEAAPDLQRLLGNARSELFHYEVRSTYDTPEVAESRRIVEEAERRGAELANGLEDPDGDEPWRRPPGQ